MKKFLTLGLVLFGFSVLSADAMTSGKTYDEALSWCESKGMSLATKAQLNNGAGVTVVFGLWKVKLLSPAVEATVANTSITSTLCVVFRS